MTPLHVDETPVDLALAGRLVAIEFPEWSDLPLTPAGGGTDNIMFRLGADLLLRVPRTPGTAAALVKEQTWLPRLAPYLPVRIPEPVAAGRPVAGFPHRWAVYRWIQGTEPSPGTVEDWPSFGRALAEFVRALRAADSMGACRSPGLNFYRGQRFADRPAWTYDVLADCADLPDEDTDLAHSRAVIDAADAAGSPHLRPTWLHGDLRPANLLAHDGRLAAVIDFGALSIGDPTAEHAAVWDLPRAAREAYRGALSVDDATWLRAAAWSLLIGLSGIVHYRISWPDFADGCRRRVREVLADPSLPGHPLAD